MMRLYEHAMACLEICSKFKRKCQQGSPFQWVLTLSVQHMLMYRIDFSASVSICSLSGDTGGRGCHTLAQHWNITVEHWDRQPEVRQGVQSANTECPKGLGVLHYLHYSTRLRPYLRESVQSCRHLPSWKTF